jgi:hypothetical protein
MIETRNQWRQDLAYIMTIDEKPFAPITVVVLQDAYFLPQHLSFPGA